MLKNPEQVSAPLSAPQDHVMIGLCLTCFSSGSKIILDSKDNAICIPCNLGIDGATK